jgi:hypothetical protein
MWFEGLAVMLEALILHSLLKLHNAELHNLHSSQNIVRKMKWAGHVACMGGRGYAYSDLVEKLKERDHRKT